MIQRPMKPAPPVMKAFVVCMKDGGKSAETGQSGNAPAVTMECREPPKFRRKPEDDSNTEGTVCYTCS